MKKFKNKIVLVTGAASGIGKATALAFAGRGATVIAADIQEDGGANLETKSKMGGRVIYRTCDVGEVAAVRQLMEFIERDYGRLDAAFNNAGVEGAQGPTGESTEDNWNRVININLRGIWACMRYEIPLMLKGEGGSIVNCASIAGLVGFPGIPAYVASKHGVIGLTKTAALEYAQQAIRVNAVCPGVIETPMIERFTQGDETAAKNLSLAEPVGRMGKPSEVADAVLWLCSDKAGFVTGHALAVDGGWVAQ